MKHAQLPFNKDNPKIRKALDNTAIKPCIICGIPTTKKEGLCGAYIHPNRPERIHFYKLCRECASPEMIYQSAVFVEDLILSGALYIRLL
jgi:hypothetical protein